MIVIVSRCESLIKNMLNMVLPFNKTGRCVVIPGSLLALVLVYCSAFGEEIYKIVDEQGNVSYSSEPPQTGQATEVIQAVPAPSEADVEDAVQRQQKIEDDFDKLDQARADQAEREAQQRANNTTVVQTNTVIGTGRRYYPHGRYRRGAAVAPGAPTAPGYRPPQDQRPRPYSPRPRTRSGP